MDQEFRTIWARLGASIKLTPEEVNTLLSASIEPYDSRKRALIIDRALKEKRIEINGDCYVPGEVIADYNAEYGTDYGEAEAAWYM